MERHSKLLEGAVYQLSWIYSADRTLSKNTQRQSSPIGFGSYNSDNDSFAHSKITSYMKAKLYAGDSLESFTLDSIE